MNHVPPKPLPTWSLQDAKAKLSAVVRAARSEGPQRVTVHGRDPVIVLSEDQYARLAPPSPPSSPLAAVHPDADGTLEKPLNNLREIMLNSPLRDLDLEIPRYKARYRRMGL